jgi:hypothetical protein
VEKLLLDLFLASLITKKKKGEARPCPEEVHELFKYMELAISIQ